MLSTNSRNWADMAVETIFTLVITITLWGFRCKHDFVGVFPDLKWILIFILWQNRRLIQDAAMAVFSAYFLLGRNSVTLFITTACSLFTLYLYQSMMAMYKHQQLDQVRRDREKEAGVKHKDLASNDLRPLLFPAEVSHTRMFPKRHSFSYSYLMVGIPIGWRGSVGSFLSADIKSLPWQGRKPLAAWFSVESADHLARGDNVHGLQGKLDLYLESINESPAQFDEAYLITAPTFLGYSFNPASFWYLYEKQKLRAMIVEVSNTFDEKRMYFLRNTDHLGPKIIPQGTFSSKWAKDFHVSPFNSREGSYGLASGDPFHRRGSGDRWFYNTIQLFSSEGAVKIVARAYSTAHSIDPSTMSGRDTLKFLLSWWWVGFVTFPRIVREAAKLFFKRRLSVWYRPEVQKDSIGRHATKAESDIAALFNDFLRTRVENSTLPFPLKYTPSTNHPPSPSLYTPNSLRTRSFLSKDHMTFTPTTPAFYAKLARSANLTDAVLPNPNPLTSLFHTSHPPLLFDLLRQSQTQPHRKAPNAMFFRLPDLVRVRWMLIKVLRNVSSKTFVLYDHQAILSDMDWYAINRSSSLKSDAYRRATIKLLASDFLTFGVPEVIDAGIWVVRVGLCWVHVGVLGEMLAGGGKVWDGSVYGVLEIVLRFLGLHLWWGVGQLM